MTDHINVTFNCDNCGESPTVLDLPDNPTDNDIAKCKTCGFEFGAYGDIKLESLQAARNELDSMFKDSVKGLKGWSFK